MKKTQLLLALALSLGASSALASTITTDGKHPSRKYLVREYFNVVGPMSDVEIEYRDIDGDGTDEIILFHRAKGGLDGFLVLTCVDRTLKTVCSDASFPTGSYKFPDKGFVTYNVNDDRQYNGELVFDLTDVTFCSKVENSTPIYTVRVARQLADGVERAAVTFDNFVASFNTTCTLTVDGKESAITIPEAIKLLPESTALECFAPELEAELTEQVEGMFVSITSGLVDHNPIYGSEATRLYCTKKLQDLLKKAETAHPEEELGPIDYDFWFMTQEDMNPSISVQYANLNDFRHGEVCISLIDNGEAYNEMTLKMVKENDEWKIDDFVTGEGDLEVSIADLLKRYIRG